MHDAAALLSRRPHRPAPEVTLGHTELALRLGRVHELCGSARRTLALSIAARTGGPVIWIHPHATPQTLCADTVSGFVNPGEILFAAPRKRDMMLWAAEESLRDGQAPVVICDLPDPPGMVPVRRLHLAAEEGCGAGLCRPLALLLTPGDGGAPGIETRWSLDPAHHEGTGHWMLSRLRARMAPPRDWLMTWTDQGLAPRGTPQETIAPNEKSTAPGNTQATDQSFGKRSDPLALAPLIR